MRETDDVLWVDANVLLRFLTGSPPEIAERASRLFGKAERGVLTLKVYPLVVAETVWVLQSFYGYSKGEISEALIPLLSDYGFKIEGGKTVLRALEVMAERNADFADALLAEVALSGDESVASFDRDFRNLGVRWHEPDGDPSPN